MRKSASLACAARVRIFPKEYEKTFNFSRLSTIYWHELAVPEIESIPLNCLSRSRMGVLQFQQAVSGSDNTRAHQNTGGVSYIAR